MHYNIYSLGIDVSRNTQILLVSLVLRDIKPLPDKPWGFALALAPALALPQAQDEDTPCKMASCHQMERGKNCGKQSHVRTHSRGWGTSSAQRHGTLSQQRTKTPLPHTTQAHCTASSLFSVAADVSRNSEREGESQRLVHRHVKPGWPCLVRPIVSHTADPPPPHTPHTDRFKLDTLPHSQQHPT